MMEDGRSGDKCCFDSRNVRLSGVKGWDNCWDGRYTGTNLR